jgi:DNA-directed RNA polymerase subunit RPC12/RpoP
MAGYTHTCAACEAKLKIHERYVGRALHCPHCGVEFLADPCLADIDDIVEQIAPATRRRIPWLAIGAAIVLLAAAAWLVATAADGPLAELFRPSRQAGQFAELVLDGRERVPVAMDHETVVFVVDAVEDPDPGSLAALRVQGRIIEVASGTKVKIIERQRESRTARVRIIDGVWTGRVVWTAEVALR